MNDNELIYLVQNHQDGVALDKLIIKYQNLMYKYIRQYNVNERDIEDYMQELRILLVKCVYKYNENYNKTFTRYYELALKRKLWSLLNVKKNKYQLIENVELFGKSDYEYDILNEEISFESLLPKSCNSFPN